MKPAGEFNRRVSLIGVGGTNTPAGWVAQETAMGAVWANRKDISDAEKVAAGVVQGLVVSRFTVRASALTRGLKPKDKLVERGLVFAITGIKQVGRQELEITAEARLDG